MNGHQWPAFIGVDPGGREVGIVTRHRREVVRFDVVDLPGGIPGSDEVQLVLDAIAGHELAAYEAAAPCRVVVVAVEGVKAPGGFAGGRKAFVNPEGIIAAAVILGGVLAAYPGAVVVPPGGNGSAPLAAYPAALIGPRERSGTGKLRHVRSAWDVTLAAPMHRQAGPPRPLRSPRNP